MSTVNLGFEAAQNEIARLWNVSYGCVPLWAILLSERLGAKMVTRLIGPGLGWEYARSFFLAHYPNAVELVDAKLKVKSA